jgi:hypothetical protein
MGIVMFYLFQIVIAKNFHIIFLISGITWGFLTIIIFVTFIQRQFLFPRVIKIEDDKIYYRKLIGKFNQASIDMITEIRIAYNKLGIIRIVFDNMKSIHITKDLLDYNKFLHSLLSRNKNIVIDQDIFDDQNE